MTLLFRLAVYIPALFLIAIVVAGQRHETARDTLRSALRWTLRWTVWSAILVAIILLLGIVFIGW